MRVLSGFLLAFLVSAQALALDIGSLSNADAVSGLKDALTQGSAAAVSGLSELVVPAGVLPASALPAPALPAPALSAPALSVPALSTPVGSVADRPAGLRP